MIIWIEERRCVIMECPFKEYLNNNLVCDYGGLKYEKGILQCPTEIFNKCQADEELTGKDRVKVMITIAKLKGVID